MKRLLSAVASVALLTSASYAQTTNGTLVGDEAFYGAALSTQKTRTAFGDANANDLVRTGGGSEINQIYAKVSGGRLNVLVTGNLEENFNKLEVFVDSKAGGMNVINGALLPTDVDGFCCGQTNSEVPTTNGALQRMNGLTFDSGFAADYYLTFSNGRENVNKRSDTAFDPNEAKNDFWAFSAHYADLTSGPTGANVRAGVQYAPQGLPKVMRAPFDYNDNSSVDTADYTKWRDSNGEIGIGLAADGNGNGTVDQSDYDNWKANFGANTGLSGADFYASNDFKTGPILSAENWPGRTQGLLIDRSYALAQGGCTDDEGNGCIAEQLEFVLKAAPDETDNGSNHRFFQNSVDLRMAIDNSNIAGVKGSGGPWDLVPGEDTPADVKTGIEFSLPLSALGNPTAGQEIKLTIFVSGGHDYLSNQFGGAGALVGDVAQGNFAGIFFGASPTRPTLNEVDGNQFVSLTVPGAASAASAAVPEPASVLVAGLVLALVGVGRKLRS